MSDTAKFSFFALAPSHFIRLIFSTTSSSSSMTTQHIVRIASCYEKRVAYFCFYPPISLSSSLQLLYTTNGNATIEQKKNYQHEKSSIKRRKKNRYLAQIFETEKMLFSPLLSAFSLVAQLIFVFIALFCS